jgi:tetrapyrrole methylase family protein / MazG family protein
MDKGTVDLEQMLRESPTLRQSVEQFARLIQIVAQLRGPHGCPWDKEQTQQSLTQYVLEESFELVEAIESNDQNAIKEELGDHVFQFVLQSQVAQDENKFAMASVLQNLCDKLMQRHPHVFGNSKVQNSSEVWQQWHKMKSDSAEKNKKPVFSYPKNLPALQAAHKIGIKTKGYEFDWSTPEDVFAKVQEEIAELEAELPEKNADRLSHEIGDVLFSVAQLARHLGLEPEACAREANRRFEKRFLKVLELSKLDREKFAKLSLEEKESLWSKAKSLT